MPITVREIGIRVRIEPPEAAPAAPQAARRREALSPVDREAMIEECVRRTLSALRRTHER